jgi:GTP cyclohydrolase I
VVIDPLEAPLTEVLEILELSGEDFDETPRRVAALLRSFNTGTPRALADILKTFSEAAENVLVVQGHIPFKGLCAHHLVPFDGTAAIGYIPRKRKVGLSKLTRLVQAAGTLVPSTQEAITNLVADVLQDTLEPLGTGVITRSYHGCMSVRGVHAPDTWTKVTALRGQLLLNPHAKSEFLQMSEM